MEEKALNRSGPDSEVRDAILSSGRLSTVIFLPSGLFYAPKGNRSRTPGAVLLFSPEPVESVQLINATMRGIPSPYASGSFLILSEEDHHWISYMTQFDITSDRISCLVSGAELAASGGINRLQYFPAGDGSGHLSTVPLVSVVRYSHRGLAFDTEDEEYSFESPFTVLRAKDLGDNEIEPTRFRFAEPGPHEIAVAALRPGDILVGLLQDTTPVAVFRGNELFIDTDAFLAGEDLFIFRPDADLIPSYGVLAIRSALLRQNISPGAVCADPESVLTDIQIPLLPIPDQYRVCAAFRDHPDLIRFLPECAAYLSRGDYQYLTGKDIVPDEFLEYPYFPGDGHDVLEEYLRENGAVLCAELIHGLASGCLMLADVCRVLLYLHQTAFFEKLRSILSDPTTPDPVIIDTFRLLLNAAPEEAGTLEPVTLLRGAELFLPEAAPDREYIGPFEELMEHLIAQGIETSPDPACSKRYFRLRMSLSRTE